MRKKLRQRKFVEAVFDVRCHAEVSYFSAECGSLHIVEEISLIGPLMTVTNTVVVGQVYVCVCMWYNALFCLHVRR